MPNHVTNKVIVQGEVAEIERFKAFVRGEEKPFCFNSIIPRPEILNKTEIGSRQEDGELVLQILEGTPANLSFLFGNPERWLKLGVRDALSYVKYMQKENPESIELARLSRQAIAETGHKDWYGWNIGNWGTKWNCYDVAIEHVDPRYLVYTFDTAWDIPDKIYEVLIAEFPTLYIEVRYFDEGHNFWGSFVAENNEVFNQRESIEDDRVLLCIELKGYDPEE